MTSDSHGQPFIVCTGGVPGAGKSTIMRRLATCVGQHPSLIVSEDLRREHQLQDPFNTEFRTKLHSLLAKEVARQADLAHDAIFVDSNLLEEVARRQIINAAGSGYLRVFIAPHASLAVLRERVSGKFGVGYMYPKDRFSADSVIDHSFYAGEPIFLEEALDIFDVVISYRTDGGYPRWWTVNSGLEAFALSLAGKISVEPSVSPSYGNDDISSIRISSWQDRWCWDPEATGLLAVSPERPATYYSRKRIIEAGQPAALSAALKTTLGDYAASYPGLLRSTLGSTQLILPSVRVVIHDGQESVLLIRRRDNGQWALVGGAHELNETITETARREVREEAGIELGQLTLATVLSGPGHVTKDQYGNVNQGLVFVFLAEVPRTTYPSTESPEVTDAAWFTLNKRPALSSRHEISLKRALEFAGTVSVT